MQFNWKFSCDLADIKGSKKYKHYWNLVGCDFSFDRGF